ncbi:MAG: hypothetical protein IKV72_07025 [Firmicutes bacterium]|nr:hypothetical protein [Bacillota bacterium]MBR4860793.1 hypothetical protein [Bacillota bacterium]MBR5489443.1 hypothetical protein [Bacillota bacterium]
MNQGEGYVPSAGNGAYSLGTIVLSLMIVILMKVVQVAVFHVISEQLLRRKLNLE